MRGNPQLKESVLFQECGLYSLHRKCFKKGLMGAISEELKKREKVEIRKDAMWLHIVSQLSMTAEKFRR